MTLYALLVGIDAYRPPAPPLGGCVNDVRALADHLQARTGTDLELELLLDADATREAVIARFGEHLGRARSGDVALFAYAGHGSEEPAPPEVAAFEPSGRIQTLMFHDCNRRVDGRLRRALADKELAVLLADVGAAGAHVAVILDCCHGGGATRQPWTTFRGWSPLADGGRRDLVDDLRMARPAGEFMAGTLERWAAPPPRHIALAACRSHEKAQEHRYGEATRGVFSMALIDALGALGPRTTYRTLLDAIRARVERSVDDQRPELFPVDRDGLGDAQFLDGAVVPVPETFSVTLGRDGWTVDAGLAHGLRPPVGEEHYVLACRDPGGGPGGPMKVVDVAIGGAVVEPIGWAPVDVTYRAVIAEVPLPAAAVVLDPEAPNDDDAVVERVHDALRRAVAGAGPAGGPSPFVRLAGPDDDAGGVRLHVAVDGAGRAQIHLGDGAAIATPVAVGDRQDGGAALVVARLEHVARWEQIRSLGSHASSLADAVRLDVYEAEPGEEVRPPSRPALARVGGYEFCYRRSAAGTWHAPEAFIDLSNLIGRPLYVAVLDLTDRFRCHTVYPTARLAAGHTVSLWDGRSIPIELPSGRPVQPGASARDWLKIVVSDVDFDATCSDLPALDEPIQRSVSRRAPATTLERLFVRAIHRASGDPEPATATWAAATVAIEVVVPR